MLSCVIDINSSTLVSVLCLEVTKMQYKIMHHFDKLHTNFTHEQPNYTLELMNSSAWDRLRDGYYNHKHNDDDKEDMYLEAMGQVVVVTMIVLIMIVAYITTFEGVGF